MRQATISADNLFQVVDRIRPFPIQLVNANHERRSWACATTETVLGANLFWIDSGVMPANSHDVGHIDHRIDGAPKGSQEDGTERMWNSDHPTNELRIFRKDTNSIQCV